jgi:RNA polymerase sigma-70 factor (ECF subfamily)
MNHQELFGSLPVTFATTTPARAGAGSRSGSVEPRGAESGRVIAFEHIYAQWFPHVSRWVLTLGARRSDYEDVVQDVFTVAYRRLDEFEGGNIAGWLYQIARRKVRDYRRLSWVKSFFTSETPLLLDYGETRPGPLDQLETKQKSELLGRRLAKLPSSQRAVFTLFELEGLSGREIAEQQQVPLNTVWIRLYTARRKLKVLPQAPRRKAGAQRRQGARTPSKQTAGC